MLVFSLLLFRWDLWNCLILVTLPGLYLFRPVAVTLTLSQSRWNSGGNFVTKIVCSAFELNVSQLWVIAFCVQNIVFMMKIVRKIVCSEKMYFYCMQMFNTKKYTPIIILFLCDAHLYMWMYCAFSHSCRSVYRKKGVQWDSLFSEDLRFFLYSTQDQRTLAGIIKCSKLQRGSVFMALSVQHSVPKNTHGIIRCSKQQRGSVFLALLEEWWLTSAVNLEMCHVLQLLGHESWQVSVELSVCFYAVLVKLHKW